MALIDTNSPVISRSPLLACHYCLVAGDSRNRFVRGTCYRSALMRGLLCVCCLCAHVPERVCPVWVWLTFPGLLQICTLTCTSVPVREPDISMLSAFSDVNWQEDVLFVNTVHQSALGPRNAHARTHTHIREHTHTLKRCHAVTSRALGSDCWSKQNVKWIFMIMCPGCF